MFFWRTYKKKWQPGFGELCEQSSNWAHEMDYLDENPRRINQIRSNLIPAFIEKSILVSKQNLPIYLEI